MLPTLASALLLAPAVPDGQWGPTTVTPTALAKMVDERLATLPRARVRFQYSYERQAVGNGSFLGTATVARPGVFRVDLPNVDEKRKFVLEREVWISDGKRFAVAMNSEPMASAAKPRPATPLKPINTWFIDFSRTILSGLGRPSHPFANLISDAGRQGFRVSTNLRQIRAYGKLFKQYRLVVAKGNVRYETIIDARWRVPSSIVNTVGITDNTRWSAVQWQFPQTPIAASEVAFKRPAPATKPSPALLRQKESPSR